jgi:hypothetical protein
MDRSLIVFGQKQKAVQRLHGFWGVPDRLNVQPNTEVASISRRIL